MKNFLSRKYIATSLSSLHNSVAKSFHDWCIRGIISDGGVSSRRINQTTRVINFGLYGLCYEFMSPKAKLLVSILQTVYKYKFIQETIIFNPYFLPYGSTWCKPENKTETNEE